MNHEDLKKITLNERGCRPIFYMAVRAKWINKKGSKTFEPEAVQTLVYKGLPKDIEIKFCKDLKERFLRDHPQANKNNEAQYNSFEVVSWELLVHLGYEVEPGI